MDRIQSCYKRMMGVYVGNKFHLNFLNLILVLAVFFVSCARGRSISVPLGSSKISCPDDYILVPHNTATGTTSDFCVAKYEMKCVGSGCPSLVAYNDAIPRSQAEGTPWGNITQIDAIAACNYLNTVEGENNKYALISNEEWMTIARNVELVNANWSSDRAGVGVLARGHTDTIPGHALEASTDDNPHYLTGNNEFQVVNSGWEQKRTLILSNGEAIWDLSGNVWEWTDWNVMANEKAYVNADGVLQTELKDFFQLNANIEPTSQMSPEKWASSFVWDFTTGAMKSSPLNKINGIGSYFEGANDSGGAAIRGGNWAGHWYAGVFALALNESADVLYAGIGFRCVFRP